MSRSSRTPRALAIAERRRRPDPASWWMWALLAASLLAAGVAQAQVAQVQAPAAPPAPPVPPSTAPNTVVPEVITPTIPPGAGGSGTTTPQPRSENPQTNGTTAPTPDRGIVVTPPANPGQTPVIRPPTGSTSDMPVIPPPGSPGGNPAVIPK